MGSSCASYERRHRNRRCPSRDRRQVGQRVRRRSAPIYGLQGFDPAMSLGTAVGAGVTGSAVGGLSILIVFRYDGPPAGTERFIRTLGGTSGYIISLSSIGNVTGQCGNGAVTASAPSKLMGAGDVDKIHVLCLSCNLIDVVLYFDRVQNGVSTALAGYAPAAGDRMTLGSTAGGASAATKLTILGVCGRNSPINLTDYQTICDASKAAGRLDLGGVSMAHMYSAPQGGAMPATILDTIGTDHLTFQSGSAANLDVVTVANEWAF